MNNVPTYTYYYSVPDYRGFPMTLNKDLTREEFIKETGIDPVTNKCIYT